MIRLVDWGFGTASTLRGRRIAITGARGALGQALVKELSQEKGTSIQTLQYGRDWDYDSYDGLEAILRKTDILILAHGSKSENVLMANCKSAISIIEIFMNIREQSTSLLRPEIWYIGSEAELHGTWTDDMRAYTDSKRAFAHYARAYYDCETFLYRHIVPAAFTSRMGRAVVSPLWTARVLLWWVRRGAQYVPVTYTGVAFLNFLRFYFWVKPLTPERRNVSGGLNHV
jgi:nucleoside-diphosphate-sugar epimerase